MKLKYLIIKDLEINEYSASNILRLTSCIHKFLSLANHPQVRKRLMNKKAGQEMSEKVKKIREIKKFGKRVQIEREQQKHKEKREMLEKVKQFRKVSVLLILTFCSTFYPPGIRFLIQVHIFFYCLILNGRIDCEETSV